MKENFGKSMETSNITEKEEVSGYEQFYDNVHPENREDAVNAAKETIMQLHSVLECMYRGIDDSSNVSLGKAIRDLEKAQKYLEKRMHEVMTEEEEQE